MTADAPSGASRFVTPSVRMWCRQVPPGGPSCAVDAGSPEDSAAALSVARFAALFGLDTRLGVYCFGLCPATAAVTLNLNRLSQAVQALCKASHQRCYQDCVQLRRERGIEGHVLALTPRDLANVRSCAEQHYLATLSKDKPPSASGNSLRKCRELFDKIRAHQAHAKLLGETAADAQLPWAATLLSEGTGAEKTLPAVLSAVFGVAVETPLQRHVQLGLLPTAQRLRSCREYAEDFAKVGSTVEETEFFVGQAPVPRPPEA